MSYVYARGLGRVQCVPGNGTFDGSGNGFRPNDHDTFLPVQHAGTSIAQKASLNRASSMQGAYDAQVSPTEDINDILSDWK